MKIWLLSGLVILVFGLFLLILRDEQSQPNPEPEATPSLPSQPEPDKQPETPEPPASDTQSTDLFSAIGLTDCRPGLPFDSPELEANDSERLKEISVNLESRTCQYGDQTLFLLKADPADKTYYLILHAQQVSGWSCRLQDFSDDESGSVFYLQLPTDWSIHTLTSQSNLIDQLKASLADQGVVAVKTIFC